MEEDTITENPKEDSVTENPKKTLLMMTLKGTCYRASKENLNLVKKT